jgi:hypothetical protein
LAVVDRCYLHSFVLKKSTFCRSFYFPFLIRFLALRYKTCFFLEFFDIGSLITWLLEKYVSLSCSWVRINQLLFGVNPFLVKLLKNIYNQSYMIIYWLQNTRLWILILQFLRMFNGLHDRLITHGGPS